jgi:hypothetical protein
MPAKGSYRKVLERLAARAGNALDATVQDRLVAKGFTLCLGDEDCPHMGKGPLLNEPIIGLMETMAGLFARDPSYSLTDYAHVAPARAVATLPAVRADAVAQDIADRIAAGTLGDIGPTELAAAFAEATQRDFASLNAILARAPDEIWALHKTLVEWEALRVLELARQTYLVEACQPFCATTALGAPEFAHFMALPCGYGVWEEQGKVWMSVMNPLAVFSNLFSDAMVGICAKPDIDSITLCRLFMKFPLIVFNDVAAVMNGVLLEYGIDDRIPLYEVGQFRAR